MWALKALSTVICLLRVGPRYNLAMDNIMQWLTNKDFWLPNGTTFADLADQPGRARPSDIFMFPVCGFVILMCRLFFIKGFANPLSAKLGLPDTTHKRPEHRPALEKQYSLCKDLTDERAAELAGDLNVSVKDVQRWFRRRRNADRPNLRTKFAEASWRCFFYTCVFVYGISMLVQSPWLWDTAKCWEGYPRQDIWPSVNIYYVLEGGFYVSLLFTVMRDVKRNDFLAQIIHHFSTVLLISFSYIVNFQRVGTLVMAVHDVSDIFLEAGKCFSYAKWDKVADITFVIFAVVFIVSRLFIYPYFVLYSAAVESFILLPPFTSFYFFNGLLIVLQVLHIFWASIIVRMAVRMWMVGKVEKDARSDVEEASTQDEGDGQDEKKDR